ncbi:TPA: hypothetical protein VB456_001587 [Streptococcus pyogenes]|nr:hypothetical protein [Streptococcus pyogenes]
MKQQSYQLLRFVYLLVALFAAMLLIARPVMADEEESARDRAYNQGLEKGTEAGKTAGYKEGYNKGFGGSYPLLIPVQFIWGLILHWWGKLN